MPILEFVCQDCQQRFEKIVQGAQQPTCPQCQGHNLERLLSVFAVGSKTASVGTEAPLGACGACGDPRGPGACSLN